MPRIRLVDGLRAVAALLVLLSHVAFWTGASCVDVAGPLLARGDSGVAVFFALSAFLLLRPWVRHGLEDAAAPTPGTYARRRLARILPGYWLALVGVLLVATLLPATGGVGSPGKALLHALLLQGYSGERYQAFTQTWSLTTEATFYVLVPLLGAALARRLRRGQVRGVLLGCAASVLVGTAAQGLTAAWTASGSPVGAGVLGSSVLGHAGWFGIGAALAVLTVAARAGALPWSSGSRAARLHQVVAVAPSTAVLAAVVVYALASTPLGGPTDLSAPGVGQAMGKELLYTLLAGLLLLAAVLPPSDAGERLGSHPAVHWAGDVSYGVFLWHVLVLQALFVGTNRPLFSGGFWWVLVPVLGLTVALASVSAQLVEQPAIRWAHRRPRVPSAPG